jgi:hypothetical protein
MVIAIRCLFLQEGHRFQSVEIDELRAGSSQSTSRGVLTTKHHFTVSNQCVENRTDAGFRGTAQQPSGLAVPN